MADTHHAETRREGDTWHPGDHATDAFALLGNETRLQILLAIWEEQVPLAPDNTVPFSRIFDRVELADRGNFSYHLEQLEGEFVTQHTERGGYELTIPGLKLVRTIIAGTGLGETTLEPTEIDQSCPLCGATTTIAYLEEVIFLSCTECEGMAPGKADVEGALTAIYFEPAGVANRTPEELHAASVAAALQQARSLFDGVCPTCSGPIEKRLECCPDHDPEGCEHCGRRIGTWAHFECQVCKNFGMPNPKWLPLFHPAVVGFYDEHGISTRVPADDYEAAKRVFGLMHDHEIAVRSTDPPRVAVTVSAGGDEVTITVDETVAVVDVQRCPPR